MVTRFLMTLALAMALLLPAAASAETVTHEEAGIEIWLPDDWAQEEEDDALLVASPDEAVVLVFAVADASDVEAALEEMGKELEELVQDFEEVGSGEETKLNGMDAFLAEGKGTIEGEPVEVGLALIMSPTGKVLIVFGIAQAAASDKHGETLGKVFSSLKPS